LIEARQVGLDPLSHHYLLAPGQAYVVARLGLHSGQDLVQPGRQVSNESTAGLDGVRAGAKAMSLQPSGQGWVIEKAGFQLQAKGAALLRSLP